MQASELQSLTSQVLLVVFGITFVFGAIAQRTHFCTMGAVSDLVNFGDWQRMRQWALAAGLAMLGFGALAYLGKIDPSKTLYAGSRVLWLSALLGGFMFGFGMVLASGCGSKTLVRIGGGSLKSVVVFLVMGVAAFATLKGITAVVRVATVDLAVWNTPTLSSLPAALTAAISLKAGQAQMLGAFLVGGGLVVWALLSKEFRSQGNNLLAGLGIGAVITAMWWTSGSLGFVAEHPDTLQEAFLTTNSGRAEALSFVAPVAYTIDWLMFFSDKAKVLTLAIVSVFGVIAGSAVVALASKSFRWEGFATVEDLGNHLVGALLMGIGGVMAMGCTIGQGLSGLSTLSLMSFLAVIAIIVGSVAAFKYQTWRLEKMV
jgi:uncharacterized protein